MPHSGFSHEFADPSVTFAQTCVIELSNPAPVRRRNEPVCIPLARLHEAVPEFNPGFFRIKHRPDRLEPLDIPSQVLSIPGEGEHLVFQVDLEPNGSLAVELQFNPEGNDLPDYLARTQSFGTWYKDGSNSAWENELTAYRCYAGIVDCFGKSYRHLCLDRLRPDSYHHERLWGQDYYMVGKSAGLGGLALFEGGEVRKCFGAPGEVPFSYTHTAFGGGPVCAGTVMTVNDAGSGGPLASSRFALFHDRYENHVRIEAAGNLSGRGARVAPGMAKFRDEHVTLDEREGFLLAWGRPVEEYGIIGTAFMWHSERYRGIHETGDTRFILLDPDDAGAVSYRSVGVWCRASAEQPAVMDPFTVLVRELAIGLNSPVRVEILGSPRVQAHAG